MVRTIIVPLLESNVDPQQVSQQALPYAEELASRTGAGIALLSVIDVPPEYEVLTRRLGVDMGDEMRAWVAEREGFLEQVAQTLATEQVSKVVRAGDAAREIVAEVEGRDDPLLVMTSHGRVGLKRLFLGSVAFRVVHQVTSPMLVVRAQDEAVVAPQLQRVLIPLDGSVFSEYALRYALDAIGPGPQKIHLVHVVKRATAYPAVTLLEAVESAEEWALTYLAGVARELEDQGHDVVWSVRQGFESDEISSIADAWGADLIAMATHGRSGFRRAFFGSVAEHVVNQSRIPVLLVRPSTEVIAQAEQAEESGEG